MRLTAFPAGELPLDDAVLPPLLAIPAGSEVVRQAVRHSAGGMMDIDLKSAGAGISVAAASQAIGFMAGQGTSPAMLVISVVVGVVGFVVRRELAKILAAVDRMPNEEQMDDLWRAVKHVNNLRARVSRLEGRAGWAPDLDD